MLLDLIFIKLNPLFLLSDNKMMFNIFQGFTSIKIFATPLAKTLSLALTVFIVSGCVKDIPPPAPPPPPIKLKFINEADIELDPHLNAPLAAVLTLQTNIRSTVEMHVSTTDASHTIKLNRAWKRHYIPVLGLRPDKEYKINVVVRSKNDKSDVLTRTLNLTTDPLPDGFPSIKLVKHVKDLSEPGYTLFDVIPEGDNAEFGSLVVIVDSYGEVVWYQIGTRYTDLSQLNNGNLLYIEGARVVEMNMLGKRVREWKARINPSKEEKKLHVKARLFHHEVYPMVNQNYLSLSVEHRPFKNYPTSLIDRNAPKKDANVVGDVIIEFRPDGSTQNQWSLLDILDPRRVGRDSLNSYWDPFFGEKTRDWSHANAVIHSPRDDSIIVTSRHQDATIKFSRENSDLVWILGPHENWNKEKFGKYLLKPVNNRKYFFPYHSHAPMIMPNGNILLYDNGNFRAGPYEKPVPPKDNFSRAVEYAIDENKMEITLVWEYGQYVDQPVFSGALGDADYLPIKNNILITHGNVVAENDKLSGRILEVTHSTPAKEVFQLDVFDETNNPKNGWRIYRSSRIADLYGPGNIINITQMSRSNK